MIIFPMFGEHVFTRLFVRSTPCWHCGQERAFHWIEAATVQIVHIESKIIPFRFSGNENTSSNSPIITTVTWSAWNSNFRNVNKISAEQFQSH